MTEKNAKTVHLITPGGFCAGVRSAIDTFYRIKQNFPGTIYVLHELVHNHRVTEKMRRDGAIFVNSLEEIPPQSIVLFGAHGVGRNEKKQAELKQLCVTDAVCPRVRKLHDAAAELSNDDELIIFGNPAHPEVQGVAGHAGTEKVFIVSSKEEIASLPEMSAPLLLCQTTRDHAEIEQFTLLLKKRYPQLRTNGGTCDAVYRRQTAVEKAMKNADVLLIAGSSHSSNANRMCDVARRLGKAAYLIENADALPDLSAFHKIALGAGASTPDEVVREILDYLLENGCRLEE